MSDLASNAVPNDVEPSDCRLRVTGAASTPLRRQPATLAELPAATVAAAFGCREERETEGLWWRGIRVERLFDRGKLTAAAGYVLVRTVDGDDACAFSTDRVANAVLPFELGGDSRPIERGGPARLAPADEGSDPWKGVKRVAEREVSAADPAAEQVALGGLG